MKNPEGPGVSFRGGGEGLEVKPLLTGGPDLVLVPKSNSIDVLSIGTKEARWA